MDEVTPSPAAQVSDRMQALLSRAVDEQATEQRAVSTVLAELRGQVGALAANLSGVPSAADVARLEGAVSAVVSDLRTATTLLGQRLDVLAGRVDQAGKDAAGPTADTTARLSDLAAQLAAQGDAIEGLSASTAAMSAFPDSLSAVQTDVAGLHDRLAPLADLRAGVDDLGARTATTWDSLAPALDALQVKVDALAVAPDPELLRDGVVEALAGRLERIEAASVATGGAGVTPDQLAAAMEKVPAAVDAAVAEPLAAVGASITAIEARLAEMAERLSDLPAATAGGPAPSAELERILEQISPLPGIHDQLTVLGEGVARLQEDPTSRTVALGLAGLREDIDGLAERLALNAPPTADEVATLVSHRVTDRLVETLAPRIADVVLARVGDALVAELAAALSPQVRRDTTEVVQAATTDSERRVISHVDDAVLALAEALLRRRTRSASAAVPPDMLLEAQLAADSHDVDSHDEPSPDPADPEGPADTEDAADTEDPTDTEDANTEDPAETDGPADAEDPDLLDVDVDVDVDEDGQPVEPVTSASERDLQELASQAATEADPPAPVPAAGSRASATSSLAAPADQGKRRPVVRPGLVLDPTPDFDDDVAEPVRGAAAPRPVPQLPPQPAPPPARRRPWWRPGG